MKTTLLTTLLSLLTFTVSYSQQIYRVGHQDTIIINKDVVYFNSANKKSDYYNIKDSCITPNVKIYETSEFIIEIYKDSIKLNILDIEEYIIYDRYDDSEYYKYFGKWLFMDSIFIEITENGIYKIRGETKILCRNASPIVMAKSSKSHFMIMVIEKDTIVLKR